MTPSDDIQTYLTGRTATAVPPGTSRGDHRQKWFKPVTILAYVDVFMLLLAIIAMAMTIGPDVAHRRSNWRHRAARGAPLSIQQFGVARDLAYLSYSQLWPNLSGVRQHLTAGMTPIPAIDYPQLLAAAGNKAEPRLS